MITTHHDAQMDLSTPNSPRNDSSPPPATAPPPPSSRSIVRQAVVEVRLTGCAAGVGLGLDDVNRVTELSVGGAAAASGAIDVGDRVVSVDGDELSGRLLRDVISPAEMHVLGVEKPPPGVSLGATATAVAASVEGGAGAKDKRASPTKLRGVSLLGRLSVTRRLSAKERGP